MSIEQKDFARRLRGRHIQLIAIGGTIGVGLFLGSAKAIQSAGPGLLLSYLVAGMAVFFVMSALGELLSYRPVAGALAVYAEEFVGPFAGFATGWTYWLYWVLVGMAELTAVGIYVRYWFPDIPQWASALGMLLLLYGSNLLAVRVFGELEFWFAVIKVTTIVALLVLGSVALCGGFGSFGRAASISNLWRYGGLFPFGIVGVLLTLQIVTFAYAGVEVVAMTAAEAQSPHTALPRATHNIIWRILIFYIGALLMILCLIPWRQLEPNVSPFVLVFDRMGIPGAAHIVNFVVITAAASSCNSGLYSTGRLLCHLAQRHQAPAGLGSLSASQVPVRAISISAAMMLVGVLLNAWVPESVFIWVTSIAVVGTLWTWLMVMLAHRGYRKAVAHDTTSRPLHGLPGAPYVTWLVIGFLLLVFAMLGLDRQTRIALYVTPIWFAILGCVYVLRIHKLFARPRAQR